MSHEHVYCLSEWKKMRGGGSDVVLVTLASPAT